MFEREKRCSRCGRGFDCGGLFGCWCRDVELEPAQLAALRQQYSDCLCRACLEAVAGLSEKAEAADPTKADVPPARG